MSIFAEALISLAVCLAVFLPLFFLKRRVLSSVPMDGDLEMSLVIEAAGKAESLEYAVAAALREAEASPFISRVVIIDGGLSPEARKRAELSAVSRENLIVTEASEWTKRKDIMK